MRGIVTKILKRCVRISPAWLAQLHAEHLIMHRNMMAPYHVSAKLNRRRDISRSFIASSDDDNFAEWAPDVTDRADLEAFAQMKPEIQRKALEEERRLKQLHRKIVKSKVIESKYFKPPPSANILSWKAKEQIRYLYSCNSTEEGLAHILETFPITEKDLRLLLKNKKLMKNQLELEKHDRQVVNKWNQLLKPVDEIPPSLRQTLESLQESGQILLLENAAGVPDVPELGSPTLQELAHRASPEPGKLTCLLMKHGNVKLRSSSASTNQIRLTSPPQPEQNMSGSCVDKQNEHKALLKKVIKNHLVNDVPSYSYQPVETEMSIVRGRMDHNDTLHDESSLDITRRGKEFVDENDQVVFRVP